LVRASAPRPALCGEVCPHLPIVHRPDLADATALAADADRIEAGAHRMRETGCERDASREGQIDAGAENADKVCLVDIRLHENVMIIDWSPAVERAVRVEFRDAITGVLLVTSQQLLIRLVPGDAGARSERRNGEQSRSSSKFHECLDVRKCTV